MEGDTLITKQDKLLLNNKESSGNQNVSAISIKACLFAAIAIQSILLLCEILSGPLFAIDGVRGLSLKDKATPCASRDLR